MLKKYEINIDTVAIVPINDEISKVYEKEEEYIVNKNSNKIIEENCKFYGSSYRGRCEGTKYLTGIKSKFPIIIEESRNIIFFPTGSIRNNYNNCWISLNNIKKYEKSLFGTEITFINNKKIPLDISLYSLDNQYYRATMLKSKLNDKKNFNFWSFFYLFGHKYDIIYIVYRSTSFCVFLIYDYFYTKKEGYNDFKKNRIN